MPLAQPASCFKTMRRLICLSLLVNSGSPEKSGSQLFAAIHCGLLGASYSSHADDYRSLEVLYSEEVIKIQQRSEKRTKPVNSLASNEPMLLLPLA